MDKPIISQADLQKAVRSVSRYIAESEKKEGNAMGIVTDF